MPIIRLTPLARAAAPRQLARPLAVHPTRLAHSKNSTTTSNSDPATLTQGHATFDKSKDSGHGEKDIQTEYVRSGKRQAEDSNSPAEEKGDSSPGAGEPFDAARQGGKGGEVKQAPAESEHGDPGQRGAMKEQVGGHGLDQGGKSGEVGGKEDAENAGGVFKSMKDMVGSGFEGLKNMREQKKNFSTLSARRYPSSPASTGDAAPKDGAGSRQPHHDPLSLPGSQSPHIDHHAPGSADQGERGGNAADEPRLPSHTTGTQPEPKPSQAGAGGVGAKREFSTGATARAGKGKQGTSEKATGGNYTGALETEGNRAGYNVPPEALPPTLESTYNESETLANSADDLTPVRETGFSSSATDPPHPVLSQRAKDGTLAERNEQPQPEAGLEGLTEAWKNRKQ